MSVAYFEKSTKVKSDLLVVRTNTQDFKKQGIKNVKKQNVLFQMMIYKKNTHKHTILDDFLKGKEEEEEE